LPQQTSHYFKNKQLTEHTTLIRGQAELVGGGGAGEVERVSRKKFFGGLVAVFLQLK